MVKSISIHALREEGDTRKTVSRNVTALFLSTPSVRRATLYLTATGLQLRISIHALREEGDTSLAGLPELEKHFYPRPPRGGRLRIVSIA